MGRILLAILIVSGQAAGAQQDDPMALQRCVWSCLANSPGAASAQYNQCVADYCLAEDDFGEPPETQIITPGQWRSGLGTDGYSYYAGTYHPSGDGRGLFYVCNRQNQSYVALVGLNAPAGDLLFVFGDLQYRIAFDRTRGELTANLAPVSQFMSHLGGPGSLRISDDRGNLLMELNLSGSGVALRYAVSVCSG